MGDAVSTDVELIDASVAGRVDAFTALVQRYQSLVCAVSYSATGDRALSEDVAQETFVAAWNGLSELREPSKLRGWLCGIARNLSSKALRRVGREIPGDAEVQAAINEVEAAPSPLDHALESESEQLVWAALQSVPKTYREPLVLFYREDQSTKQVAEALGLSENAVQQRLSRGRQHLKASVADLVERTLERTKPSKGFVVGVVAAISVAAAGTAQAASSQAASSGSSASAGSTLAFTGGLLTMKTLKIGAVAILVLLLALAGVSVLGGSKSSGANDDYNAAGGSALDRLASLDSNRRQRPDPRTAAPASASGRVVDAATGAGIVGARIVLTDTALDAGAAKSPGAIPGLITAVSGADGAWAIERVPYGDYLVSAAAEGFVPGVLRDVELKPGAKEIDLEVRLAQGGELFMGTVSDVGGGPVAGALVNAIRLDRGSLFEIRRPGFAAASNGDGRFRLSLERGTYLVMVEHQDYVSQSRTLDVSRSQQREDFRLAPGGVLEGRVLVKGSQEPVVGAFVMVEGGRGKSDATGMASSIAREFSIRAAATDHNGAFRFTGVGSGPVELVARAAGYSSVQPLDVDLGIAEQASDLVVWVEAAHTVSGYVVAKEDGKPIAGALVIVSELGRETNNYASPSKTGDDGFFEVVGVRPGKYFASAVTEGRETRLMGVQVSVESKDVSDLVIEVAQGATLAGRVEPAAAAKISLRIDMGENTGFQDIFAAMGAVFVSVETESDGSFVLRGVPAGSFDLVAVTRDGRQGLLPVTVSGDGKDRLLIRLADQASVSGRVVDELGEPVVGHRVRVHRMDGPPDTFSISDFTGGNRAWTDADGHFRAVGLEAGNYQVSVHGQRPPENVASTGFMLPFAKAESPFMPEVLVLGPREARTGMVLTVGRSSGVIDGVVVDHTGAPMADAWVAARWLPVDGEIMSWGPEHEGPVLTDADGGFQLQGLRKGAYRLVANHASISARARSEKVQTGESVTLRLSALGGLRCQVTQNGEPVKAFTVKLTGPSQRERTVSSASGEFALDGLDTGRYQVYVTAESGAASTEIDVRSGEPRVAELSLSGWGSVSGRVVSLETGEPLSGLSVLPLSEHGNRKHDIFGNMATGMGPKTDADGRFRIADLGRGKGLVTVYTGGFTGSEAIASTLFELTQGQDLDLGELRAVSPPSKPNREQRGFLGLEVEAGTWIRADANQDGQAGHPSFESKDRVLRVTCSLPMRLECQAPATDAGIATGDQILAINGMEVEQFGPQAAGLMLRFGRVQIGQEFDLRLRRDRKEFDVKLVAIPLPATITDMLPEGQR